jgi:methyl-accepting chemotaxis protein
MNKWTIGKRILFGFAIIILIVVGLGAFSWERLYTVNTEANLLINDSLPGLMLISETQDNARQNYIDILNHVMSTNQQEKAQLAASIEGTRQKNSSLYKEYEATITQSRDRDLYNAVTAVRPAYSEAVDEVKKLSDALKTEQAVDMVRTRLRPALETYNKALQAEVDFNKSMQDISAKRIVTSVSTAKTGILIGLGIAVLAGIGVGIFMTKTISNILKKITASLDDGATQVASAASQVSSSSQTLAEGSSEQAASIEQTSSSLEEMSSMTKRNADNAQKANDLARDARAAADNGANEMQSMSQAMNEIKTSSDDIGKIIKTIDEIAFQTNILALNAAVEAARAGEAGMGFAVVADEVRNLAQRSAQAAKETAGKIEGAIEKTAQGVEISTKVGAQLQEIVSKVRQVDELIGEVSAASKEQSQGIEQVNTAVGQMDAVTQSTAAAAEESASAAEELNAQAESLKASVNELLQLVGANEQKATPVTTAAVSKRATLNVSRKAAPTRQVAVKHAENPRFAEQGIELVSDASKRSAIPLEGDFKNIT